MHEVKLKNITIGQGHPLAIMCGPCVIESEEHAYDCALQLKKMFAELDLPLIFKASYDKANRSAYESFRGPGITEGLRILERIQKELNLSIITDVHSPEEAEEAGRVCDIIQIPAFLCRQTDLIFAAARTPAAVNIKKGQFMAPWDMCNAIDKVLSQGNKRIIVTERGTSFGYNNLTSDMRAIPLMQAFGYPVCFDATHSVQLPGGLGKSSGGQREFIPLLAKAAVASGANCLFIEAHPDPTNAKSDASTVMDFKDIPPLLKTLKRLYEVIQTSNL
ncbi:MAG: 3-deoxy-8-phosphooctulonate synthase [Chlamydiae bacterium]|nr:3-deoxy-8-phosphooctulonate synthase [Chlamydiota bacterium]